MSLLTLPVEILYHIIDYLDISTIFLSFSNVCTYLRIISKTYNHYQFDFRSISKTKFHYIYQLIQPENILSLTLSDENKTPGEIRLFFSSFNIDQFTRLLSLTLLEIDEDDLNKILHENITSTITSLVINWRESHCPSQTTLTSLSSILNRLKLRKLELKTGSYAIEEMLWPVQYTLEHLILMYVTQKQYCTILRETPNLKTLTLNHCSMHKIDEYIITLSDPILYEQLTSLILTDSRMMMNELTSVLSLTPSLNYLKIISLPDSFNTISDGSQWEQFISTNLPLLHKFEFFFTNMYNVYYESRDVQLLVSRFQTRFWLEEKHWYVVCDYIDYLNQTMLYTIPLCSTDFTYECQANKISYSSLLTMETDTKITENVRAINLTLTKLMAGVATMKNELSNQYLFRNLTRLTIDVDQEWSKECVEFLSKIINLSRLDKITFNPDLNPNSIHNTLNNIHILMKLAYNLSTLAIHPYSSYNDIINMEIICSMIPHHIKYLELTIRDINSMKIILDHHEQLWSLTLLASSDRSTPWSDFIDELIYRKKYFVYWQSYYSLHIWFGQTRKY
ncbi:unnamed protein product [Rotaria sordida]|uniref:F-box domain-containing protein n=1 Tax=Rotaria sordida TaxID=392033 RepID=A0A818VH42_9BILA|nr:unnamed protein product [Rotaria sordida]